MLKNLALKGRTSCTVNDNGSVTKKPGYSGVFIKGDYPLSLSFALFAFGIAF
jgi:hypothetical protein